MTLEPQKLSEMFGATFGPTASLTFKTPVDAHFDVLFDHIAAAAHRRSLGPSLGAFGVSGALPDPMIKLVDQNGSQIASNDDWRTNEAAIQAQAPTLAPSRNEEPALVAALAPGQYTAIAEGKNATGVAAVEIYALTSP